MRGKNPNTLIASLLILEIDNDNSSPTTKSSSIRLSNEGRN